MRKEFPANNKYLKPDKYHKYNKIQKNQCNLSMTWLTHHHNIYPQTSFQLYLLLLCSLTPGNTRTTGFYHNLASGPTASFHSIRPVGTVGMLPSPSFYSAHHRKPVNLRDEMLRQGILLYLENQLTKMAD